MINKLTSFLKTQLHQWRLRRQLRYTKFWRGRLGTCGDNFLLFGAVKTIKSPKKVTIGHNVQIGDNIWMQADGGINIGNNVVISHNCVMHTVNHDFIRPNALPFGTDSIHRPITIEDNVWLGMNVLITPGAIIREGCVIGMGAVVAGEIPPLSIAVGNPAKVVSNRDRETYQRLIKEQKWLAHLRNLPMYHGWSAPRALRQWQSTLQTLLDEQGFVTTQLLTSKNIPFPAALLYAWANSDPDLQLTHHLDEYMVYSQAKVQGEIKSDGQTSVPLEPQEQQKWIHSKK